MSYARIVVKDNYTRRGDLVLRSYVRALQKIEAKALLNGNVAYIYGIVDDNGIFHELFTGRDIGFNRFEYISRDEILKLTLLSEEQVNDVKNIIKRVLFNENSKLDFEISTPLELAEDRKIEFEAYSEFLSRINPYTRLNDNDSGYDDFAQKIEALKTMEKYDNIEPGFDEYDIDSYCEAYEKMSYSGFQKRIGK